MKRLDCSRDTLALCALSLAIVAILSVGSCSDAWGLLDNPVDPESDWYQGYLTVAEPGEVMPTVLDPTPDCFVPTLTANQLIGAEAYRFQISGDSQFASLLYEAEQSSNRRVPTDWNTWVPSMDYFWRVRVRYDGAWNPWPASYATFSVLPMGGGAIEPADEGYTADREPLLDWDDADGAVAYELQLRDSESLIASSEIIETAVSEYQTAGVLSSGDARFWRIRACNADGVKSAWSDTWSFIARYFEELLTNPPYESLVREALAEFPFDSGGCDSDEAREMLSWLGAEYYTSQGTGDVTGQFESGYYLTIWNDTYGKYGVYGFRYGTQYATYWSSNATYYEIAKP